MSPAILSTLILVFALAMFVSEKVRHDLVALLALFACLFAGLTTPEKALAGFADPAVISVAAVLVVGRAVELSGIAAAVARNIVPATAGFAVRLSTLLLVGAALSAFMNNIAALVITMPIATEIARQSKRAPAATLMPLAFATIHGGMTTLIGTPANLILSSVRETELGAPFGFFQMAPVGGAVAVAGLIYLGLIGWRLLPIRQSARDLARVPWRVFELTAKTALPRDALLARLRSMSVRLLAAYRNDARLPATGDLATDDTLLLLSRGNQWSLAEATGLLSSLDPALVANGVTARVAVAHGSFLIGLSHEAVRIRSNHELAVVAAGPRAARQRVPLATLRIEAGDQLFVRGEPDALTRFSTSARLLEIDRLDPVPIDRRRALAILAIFICAIAAIVLGHVSPALAFLGAAVTLAATRLIAADEIYRSIDWSVVVLLAAMIPVGQSFETSGAAATAAKLLAQLLTGAPLPLVLMAICAVTILLSIFLNNVATAIIMGPLAIDAAGMLGVSPDAALLAVLVGASADFLTPIGHQNNLLVMGPGGYRFSDYARMGAPLVMLVVLITGAVLTLG
ncbi:MULTISPECIES: SLC13 family permease [Sphingosinicellaceae]|uniref:SLC13 family permease n=1 Tax=Sphingosinicellaceae TaxID=2820280 RepID=UPI001C1E030D|nr:MULTISPECIES: SLC13 family permease [Polymorphobacter]QYE33480.1 SLC13 family permease [Polymorphobacter sp. PAMC 29334]UAJ12843.1 SLC13 family permease [Polymorphobacter megasporae]